MARYTGPVCKLCRRDGEKLFLKGARCLSAKCSVERRTYPPGQHGKDAQFRRGRGSDYSLQLREKQKARRIYGVLERQFRRYFSEALRRPGLTGSNLLTILESRLDNVVYRLGWADSRAHARQIVQHGHITINGRRTNIPSYLVRPNDVVAIRDESRSRQYFKELRAYMEDRPQAPEWLSVNMGAMAGTVLRVPERRDVDLPLNEQLIVEYYSR
ncbi:MAG TPA: 30S ribosomal protein S4 [Aggregatilinea sp.]|jgi:small subunit ribosomal protein S4|uniref:30S ribosomal protein S4 n=1 Tax=Aggregatilinea sp. TaxID=2806333 RepID=UPI002C76A32E|nr:30S ribosomal protein S4 [Aggregatilinea sp.]HML22146.1 30S ribosomal protein S4 [Aggregatilinea sp.]